MIGSIRTCYNPRCQYGTLVSHTESRRCPKCGWNKDGPPFSDQPTTTSLAPTTPSSVITIHVAPCPAPRQVRSDSWKPSKRVQRYRAWKDKVRPILAAHNWTLGDTLNIHFVVPMPKSWSKKKRERMDGKPHQQKPDIDNYAKAFCDLTGEDDSHVWFIIAKKTWGESGMIIVHRARMGDHG